MFDIRDRIIALSGWKDARTRASRGIKGKCDLRARMLGRSRLARRQAAVTASASRREHLEVTPADATPFVAVGSARGSGACQAKQRQAYAIGSQVGSGGRPTFSQAQSRSGWRVVRRQPEPSIRRRRSAPSATRRTSRRAVSYASRSCGCRECAPPPTSSPAQVSAPFLHFLPSSRAALCYERYMHMHTCAKRKYTKLARR